MRHDEIVGNVVSPQRSSLDLNLLQSIFSKEKCGLTEFEPHTPQVASFLYSPPKRSGMRYWPLVVLASGFFPGCATWLDQSPRLEDQLEATSQFLAKTDNKRSIQLEVSFHPVSEQLATEDGLASLWQWVDEMVIDAGQRSALSRNGVRAGRIIREDQFLAKLSALAPATDIVDSFLSEANVASDMSRGSRTIPMRMGRRYELPLKQPNDGTHVTMVNLDGQLIGKTLQDPQYIFGITPTQGSRVGEVILQLRPEVQHGMMRQKWVSSDTALRIDTRRETWSLDSLDIHLSGAEDDVFAIGGVSPSTGIGQQMFSGLSADNLPEKVVLLIRLKHLPEISQL